ncbi:response regulator [Algibacter lectus]|uniref:Response regulator receiver domain-containing protein n=2 Tax=Algibacter lectus TaxID=221126 RepID=A0A4R8M6F0_9FLAO|nr:response regulator [Algibacter lectus]MDO7136766.1 response regulator [Algibacter lectus]MWW25668.1 response regulator [Algibacter lectus]TDY60949.1 response regulator receiver domain-containing protein [Algibacter lectus]SFD52106.1 Response regulator receiver domain-containing protein [Algibacter lectus]
MKKINLACIIEDDPTHVYITKRFLNLTGLVESILICSNGKDAFTKLKAIISSGEKLPELILLDLNMPVWDGWQFLDAFKEIPVEDKIDIYILTSSNNEADIERAKNYNIDSNYIVKPITLEKLKDVIFSE